jgi:hypothetical protein
MYDGYNNEEVTFITPKTLYKKSDIVNAIKNDFAEQLRKEYELKRAYEVAKFKASNELHRILTQAAEIFSEHRTFFEKAVETNISSNISCSYPYVGYAEEQKIDNNVTKLLIDNEEYTYKQIYDFATKDLKND